MIEMRYRVYIKTPGKYTLDALDMKGTGYSDILCRCMINYPKLGKDCFIIEETGQSWEEFETDLRRFGCD